MTEVDGYLPASGAFPGCLLALRDAPEVVCVSPGDGYDRRPGFEPPYRSTPAVTRIASTNTRCTVLVSMMVLGGGKHPSIGVLWGRRIWEHSIQGGRRITCAFRRNFAPR